jgi:hypothetical protein
VRLPVHHVQQDVTVAIVRRVILDNLELETTKTVLSVTIVQKVGTKMSKDKEVVCHVFREHFPPKRD